MHHHPQTACPHLTAGPYPFESALVLDDHLGPTDWLVRCRSCQATYVFEMLDWAGQQRLYRMRAPEAEAVTGLLRNLERGSCDLDRARAEANHVNLSSMPLGLLALLDLSRGTLVELIPVPENEDIPTAGWRELPCDGGWIQRLSSNLSVSD